MRKRLRVPLLTVGLLAVCLLTAVGLTRPLPVLRLARLLSGRVLPPAPARFVPTRVYPSARPVEVLTLEASGQQWVDSVFQTLTPEQKIGQFFMVAAFSNRHEGHYQYIDHLVETYHIGGLIFFQGGPYRQAILTNRYQALAKVPLLIGIDGEWGLGMRLDSTMEFPKQMTLGAINSPDHIRQMGDEIGRQCQRLGIQINFAPVSDINSNPANPVIGNRSFGETRENVATKAIAYMQGLQGRHVIATAKHFPGHGDANTDSHHTLPLISRSSEQLRNIDLYPFRRLIADSLMGVVTGHLHVPVVDNSSPALAATLSEKIVTDLLKRELGFRGLVFTDALNMAGVSRSGRRDDVNLRALQAGNDILLYPENVKEAARVILEAVQQGKISQELIDEKVLKILRAKYWAGLSRRQPISLVNLAADLDAPEAHQLKADLSEQAVTVVNDPQGLLPLKRLDTLQLASVSIGAERTFGPAGAEHTGETVFQRGINQFASCIHLALPDKPNTEAELAEVLTQLGPANVVLLSYHRMSESAHRRFGVTKASTDLIGRLQKLGKKVIVTAFGSPYSLPVFAGADALVCAYQDFDEMQQTVPQVLFGGLGAKGILPVSAGEWRAGTGIRLEPGGRLATGTPESAGMKSAVLARIDGLVQAAIRDRVVPGCQVLVARKGRIVYSKNFGGLTYGPTAERVTDGTLYDLASLTKVLSTLQAVMWLYDRKLLDLDQRASFYLPELRGTTKQAITIRDLLWHQSGLIAFYPQLWDRTRAPGGGLKPEYYSPVADSLHTLQIAPTLWAKPALRDSVWKWVIQSPLSRKTDESGKPAYVYSDLGFLTLQKVVERISRQPLDKFVAAQIFKPLGLTNIGFTPLQRLPNPRCAPTEQDSYFRNSLLVGTVHDQMAAVQGGVSGHAGLFGNAQDIARLLQMNLQNGEYGGSRLYQAGTVPYFTQTISPRSYRALGWDKPNPTDNSVYLADQATERSFGHTGFTGNMVWVDPEKELVFVFLSNRIHPTAANTLINTTKLRRRINELVYLSIQ
jgi:beta-N-acetylhexosaminidase